jgi:hypothetical protein
MGFALQPCTIWDIFKSHPGNRESPVNLKQLLGFSALAVLALGALSGCGLCKDEILEETPSPDGKWTAIILTGTAGLRQVNTCTSSYKIQTTSILVNTTVFLQPSTFIGCMSPGIGIRVLS